jgi:hypothetical protein
MSDSVLSLRERLSLPESPRQPRRERREAALRSRVDLTVFLNPDQRHELRAIEGFGWRLAFVRRPLFQEVVPVVESADSRQRYVMDVHGHLRTHTVVPVR